MNTSDPEKQIPEFPLQETAGVPLNTGAIASAALASGISVEQLERMANEIFSGFPGSGAENSVDVARHEIEKQSNAHPRALNYANLLFNETTPTGAEPLDAGSAVKRSFSGLPAAELPNPARHIPLPADIPAYSIPSALTETPLGYTPVTKTVAPGYGIAGETVIIERLNPYLAVSTPVPPNPASGSSFYFLDNIKLPEENLKIPAIANAYPPFDVYAIRRDFPILKERVNGRLLVWMDNAATTQKPSSVINRLSSFYLHENSNIHRAAHELAARATDAYEDARNTVARFLHASTSDEIVFVRGTTEAINLVAQSWGRRNIGKDDEIVISWLEHHANIVPWQQLCSETGARLRVAPVDDDGQILLDEYEKLFNSHTKLAALTQVSNALGTVTPVREMVEIAHRYGARVLVDGAQSVSHMRVDVQALDCDWFVFSGHKIFGPTGIGVLYGKLDLLNSMPPWQGGGNMIQDVTFEKIVYQQAPSRFEAGTGNIADAAGLGAALEYVERIGIENIGRYEHELLVYATHCLSAIPGLRIIGTAADKASVLSFVLEGFKSEDVGSALNKNGIAVRAGHHCAQPILRRFGVETTVRPSLAFYNTYEEIDQLAESLRRIQSRSNQK